MESIKEKLPKPRLPDFCNLGIWLRILLGVNAVVLACLAAAARPQAAWTQEFIDAAALVEPIVLASLALLCAASRLPLRLPPLLAAVAAVAGVAGVAMAVTALLAPFAGWSWRPAGLSVLLAMALLGYFDLAERARSPAVTEARLQALTARIRPHFLFNSLNAVLGVIRSDPRRAEVALEELSDLFRALMRDNRELVPLSDEIALVRQYVELEKLRLGERLQVRWEVDSCPPDALVPPLMLQPLVENAVYHGVEPLDDSGEIRIRLGRDGDRLNLEVANPVPGGQTQWTGHHGGNQMALANIRERLLLFFDLEADLSSSLRDGRYVVRISLPYRREKT